MLYTRMGTKVALNTQRKPISTTVRKEPETFLISTFLISQTVKTNVAKSICRLLDKHFPKSHPLYKIFNRNTSYSYSCMNNVSQIIKQYNKNVSNKKEKQTNSCNCRNKNKCPLNGNCKVQDVIYKCTVSATQTLKQRVCLEKAEGIQTIFQRQEA